MKFRELNLNDLDYCAKHRAQNYSETFPEAREKLRDKILRSKIKIIVPETGYALLRDDEEKGLAHLSAILVEKKHQGKGYGTRLLKLVEEEVLKNGYYGLVLSVRPGEDLVKKFYEKNGYTFFKDVSGRFFYKKKLR